MTIQPLSEGSDADQMKGHLADNALSLDLVSALAGDRSLTDDERALIDDMQKTRGGHFFCDLLYAIAHHHFPPEMAQDLWDQILQHKYAMSAIMKRNLRIGVACMDYLSNLTSALPSATVIAEDRMAAIVRLSLCDSLTGLFNHASCYHRLDRELQRYAGNGVPVSLMMIDIDNFKEINDQHGHQEGDKILATVGAVIRGAVRESDICCRYGGEEFAVILPATDAQEAGVLADSLRAKLVQSLAGDPNVTVSIGVASCGQHTNTSQALVRKADSALYVAKASGKNRVVLSEQQDAGPDPE